MCDPSGCAAATMRSAISPLSRAGVAVYFTNTPWPDLIVAMLMAWLSLWSAGQIIRHARDDLREHEAAQAAE